MEKQNTFHIYFLKSNKFKEKRGFYGYKTISTEITGFYIENI